VKAPSFGSGFPRSRRWALLPMAVQRGLTDALRTPPIPKETPDENDRVRGYESAGAAEAITVASGLSKNLGLRLATRDSPRQDVQRVA
jgi:hypothetical protein